VKRIQKEKQRGQGWRPNYLAWTNCERGQENSGAVITSDWKRRDCNTDVWYRNKYKVP